MNLNFISTISDGTLRITVGSTRLDAALADEFKARVEAAWTAEVDRVEINLGAVEFLDSSGVGALISIFRKLPSGRGLTRLTHVRPGVWAVFELLHLCALFELAAGATPLGSAPEFQPIGA